MKTWKQCAFVGFLAIIAFAMIFTACDDSNNDPVLCTCVEKAHLEAGKLCDCGGTDCTCSEKPVVPEATTRSLTFIYNDTPADGTFSVMVKTEDEYTTDAWNTLVHELVTAIETYYSTGSTTGGRSSLRTAFGAEGATIILKNDLGGNWLVEKEGELYLNPNSITTTNYQDAANAMVDGEGSASSSQE